MGRHFLLGKYLELLCKVGGGKESCLKWSLFLMTGDEGGSWPLLQGTLKGSRPYLTTLLTFLFALFLDVV